MKLFNKYVIIMTVLILIAIGLTLHMDIEIDSQFIPTVVNGLTASTSIIVGLSGTVIGIMLREGNKEPKAKTFYILSLALLLVPISMLWSTYIFLVIGPNTIFGPDTLQFAVKYGLVSFILALYEFFTVIAYIVTSLGL